MRTISIRIEFDSLVEDGSYDAVETCRLTVPDDVSEIEVAEILKKAHEDKDVYKDGYCPYTLLNYICEKQGWLFSEFPFDVELDFKQENKNFYEKMEEILWQLQDTNL